MAAIAEQGQRHTARVRAALERLPDWQFVLVALLATRAVLIAVGLVASSAVLRGATFLDLVPSMPWLSSWVQFDAEYYVEIAVAGYSHRVDDFSNTAFFPLYPLLTRFGALLLGPIDTSTVALSGFVVANGALFTSLVYLAALVRRDFNGATARRAVVFILVFPTTVFLSAVYAEALFLAGAVASIYYARRGEWYRAGVAGGVAALARPFGIVLLVPLIVEMLRQRPSRRALPALALIPAGTVAFFGYLWWQLGDPMLYLRANAFWGRGVSWPWTVLREYLNQPLVVFGWPHSWVDLAFVVAMAVLAVLAWRRLPDSHSAFAAAGLLFTLSSSVWISTPRHAMALFPLTILLAVYAERRWFYMAWLVLSAALAVGFAARFFTGNWVA